MPQSILLKASGLYTFPNTLSEVPQGALTVADNTIIDRNGIIESRRGFQQYGTTFGSGTDTASQLMTYKKRLLMQDLQNSFIWFDSDGLGTFEAFSGSFPPAQAGLRTKYVEANGNFYFTSANGIECISAVTSSDFTTAVDYIRPSGGIQALDVSGIVDYSTGGWFIYPSSSPGQTKVGYRVTWSFYDANKDLVEGVPSSQLVVTNFSEVDSATVTLTFQIPAQILDLAPNNTQFFYTIYRTAVVQTSVGVTLAQLFPGDEEYQVIQAFPTPAQLLAGSVTVNDPTPESFRANGALLYTNPVSGEGILQSNYPPPFALDINLYQQTTFYANTATIQQLNLALLSTEALISGTSTVTVGGVTYTFVGTPEIQDFTFDTQANTTDGGYFLINSSSNVRQYFVWFNKSGSAESQTLTFATGSPTDGSYFLINSANDTDQYFVWFDSTGSTPVPTGTDTFGRIGIRVSSASLTTGALVASAVAAVLPTIDFIPLASSNSVNVTNAANGVTTAASNGLFPVSGLTFSVNHAGTDPTPAPANADTIGRVGIAVDISQAVTADDVANDTNIALNENSDFDSVILSGPTIQVTNADNGVTTEASNSTFVPVGGDFAITLVQAGTGTTGSFYTFTTSPATTSTGAVYTNNSQSFTVISSINAGTTLLMKGTGTPSGPPGTLTKVSGTGDATISYTAFTFTQNEVLLGNNVSPAISIEETARSLVAAINQSTTSTVVAFYQSGPTDLPGLILIQSKNLTSPAFSMTANSTATGDEFSPALPTSGDSVISTNLVQVNAIYYSKFQQPEAVPIVNNFLVGPKDKAILRILPIRTGLMIFKEDGIYQLTGTNGQFTINPFDSSALILAPDSAQVLNNQIYMFCTQGVVTVTDTGVSVISRPIENSLQQVIAPGFDYVPNTFGVSYESDRAYLLWTVTNSDDTVPTQCFRYNTFTNAWTRWPITKTCGVVLINQNILYLGPTDANFIEQERKNINRTDYADRTFPLEIPDGSFITPTELTLSSTENVDAGDGLVQVQNLTIADYNQMLQKLDLDPTTGFHDYFATLQAFPGVDLRAAVNNLALRLDTDPGLAETNFFSSLGLGPTFIDIQNDFNILVTLLNANPHISYPNFPESTGTLTFETSVVSTINNSTNVNILYPIPFVVGPVTNFKGIPTSITWTPQTFGDPSISKHVSEGTFLFENTSFYSATASYASDLSQNFESVPFPEEGIGDWGTFFWNSQNWGGNGTQVPLRTYIPRFKQYCRFILPNFQHINAREKYSLYGTSLTFRPLTERAYRS